MTDLVVSSPTPTPAFSGFLPRRGRGRPPKNKHDHGSAVAVAGRKPGVKPELLLAVAVMEDAIRDVRGWWQAGQPLDKQPAEVRLAVKFLLHGADLPSPTLWHELSQMEVLMDMDEEELVRRILTNRRFARLGGDD